jgi:thioesterase domain-containing protein
VTTQEFLIELKRLDVQIWMEGDRIRCSAPPDVLTVERRAELAARRPEIESLLKAARAVRSGSIVPIETGGPLKPFYAVPGHNGDVFCFVRLARSMAPQVPFFGLQPPGLEPAMKPVARVEDLAAHFVRELVQHQPEGPYQLGGYCLGGLTAFEMARQLRAMGREVSALVLFGTMSPPALRPLTRAQAAVTEWTKDRVRGLRTFVRASGRERLAKLAEKAHISGERGNAAAADEFTIRRLAVEEATLEAAHGYRPEPYDGRISLFLANEASTHSLDQPLAWGDYAKGGLDVFYGPPDCDGDSMLKDDSAAVFGSALMLRLQASPCCVHGVPA